MTEIKKFKFTVEIPINASLQTSAKFRLRHVLNEGGLGNFEIKEIKEIA